MKRLETHLSQEVAAEAARQGDGASRDISELFGNLGDEVEPSMEVRATRRTRATVAETSKSESEERTRA